MVKFLKQPKIMGEERVFEEFFRDFFKVRQ